MIFKPSAVLVSLALALSACHDAPQGATPTPEPTAPEAAAYAPPEAVVTAVPSAALGVSALPAATPCGAEKLQNYLNLLPTTTAKDEIVRSLGHSRVRYVPLKQEKAEGSRGSSRVTAGLGVDGRIKEFTCG